DGLERLLANASGFDGERDLGIDVGEAFEITFGMARRNARHPRGRLPRIRSAAGDDAGRFLERRPKEIVRIVLPPVKAALRAIDAHHEAVLVAGRDLARPDRATRAVGVAQHDLRIVVEPPPSAE